MVIQKLSECREVAEVGGKGANLGKLVRAGFSVPPGFVVTVAAYRRAQELLGTGGVPSEVPDEIAGEILAAYRELGGGPVAVRSSATAEDMAAASMAGQYETFLDVWGEDQVLEKVRQCWASMDSPRIRAYLQEHGIDRAAVAMGVVIQRLVPADVAGVLFTINPNGGSGGGVINARNEMLIEASWGLGESVVSGKVQPDVIRVDAATGRILEMVVADKRTMLAAGSHEERPVDDAHRKAACLTEADILKLWELGKRGADHFGGPQDMEWAISKGELFLLQSRPITTHLDAESKEEVLAAARANVRTLAAAGRGPWVLHNLAETLAHPTPLTWSVIRHFMSGTGGFGNMYRMAGFEPGPAVCSTDETAHCGFLDLIGGKIYMDASLAPEMFFADFPFAYDVEELKRRPDASQSPPTLPRGSLRARMQAGRKLAAVNERLRAVAENFDRQMREEHIPALLEYVTPAKAIDLRALSNQVLAGLWQQHEHRVMDQFGPLSLMPSLICGMALGELKTFLEEHLWDEDADALAQMLSAGGIANRTVIADAELFEVAQGERAAKTWLADHGHRAAGEFDLAAPRWREQRGALLEMAGRLTTGERPLERHRRSSEDVNHRVTAIHEKLPPHLVAELDRKLGLVRRYMPFREDGKDYFMMGYDLLRDLALEMGRRIGIGEDVFFLTKSEMLAALTASDRSALPALIEGRKRVYRAEARVSLPHVIDKPEVIGAPPVGEADARSLAGAGGIKGFAISGGRAVGKARILRSPTDAGALEPGYILVCPSTDPSWTPLFVNAAGLILEVGGTLSHGAVVAREMGLPAVVLADATELFKDGEEIVVDGTSGWVGRAGATAEKAATHAVDPNDTTIPRHLVPPVEGPKDRHAAKIRNRFAAVWAVFVLAFFLLPPAWGGGVYGPTLVFLDHLLWPLVRTVGKPWTVVLVASLIAIVTLTLQKLLTDNARLVEAKRRAGILLQEAASLPPDSPRRKALQRLAAPVQARVLMAALVPVGILLGPMVLPFAWFKDRVEPSVWNAPAGTPVEVVALVDPEWTTPVALGVVNRDVGSPQLEVDISTPVIQSVPPVRATLEHLLALYQSPSATKAWQVKAGPETAPAAAAADLKSYLDAGIPAQPLRWRLVPADGLGGKFFVHLATGKFESNIDVVLGDAYAPTPTTLPGTGPIKQLRVNYGAAATQKIFWRPFGALAGQTGALGKLGAWDAGWVWLYILAYLPVLFGVRWALKVA